MVRGAKAEDLLATSARATMMRRARGKVVVLVLVTGGRTLMARVAERQPRSSARGASTTLPTTLYNRQADSLRYTKTPRRMERRTGALSNGSRCLVLLDSLLTRTTQTKCKLLLPPSDFLGMTSVMDES
jgi:hypothetical protein